MKPTFWMYALHMLHRQVPHFHFFFLSQIWLMLPRFLKYYATFKVRKSGSLFYKINTCLQKTTTCIITSRANILSKYIIYIFFNFARGFYGSFPMLFPKAPAYCCTKFWTNFCCIVLLYLWAQKSCLRFLISYFKLEILIFLSFVVSFLVDIFH